MDLDSYLRDSGTTGIDFAGLIGVTEASLSRIRRGNQNITRDLIRRIVEVTGGKVTAAELVFPPDHDSDHGTALAAPSPDIAAEKIGIALPAAPASPQDGPEQSGRTSAGSRLDRTGTSAAPAVFPGCPATGAAGAADLACGESGGLRP